MQQRNNNNFPVKSMVRETCISAKPDSLNNKNSILISYHAVALTGNLFHP